MDLGIAGLVMSIDNRPGCTTSAHLRTTFIDVISAYARLYPRLTWLSDTLGECQEHACRTVGAVAAERGRY